MPVLFTLSLVYQLRVIIICFLINLEPLECSHAITCLINCSLFISSVAFTASRAVLLRTWDYQFDELISWTPRPESFFFFFNKQTWNLKNLNVLAVRWTVETLHRYTSCILIQMTTWELSLTGFESPKLPHPFTSTEVVTKGPSLWLELTLSYSLMATKS